MNDLGMLYPELQECGGLATALRREFSLVTPPLQIAGYDFADFRGFQADAGIIHAPSEVISENGRQASLDVGVERRCYMLDIGKSKSEPVLSVELDSLQEAIALIYAWVINTATISDVKSSTASTSLLDLADDLQFIQWQWKTYWRCALNGTGIFTRLLAPLIALALTDPVLGRLTPYTSHDELHLSRCTYHPFSGDCPFARPLLPSGTYNGFIKASGTRDTALAERMIPTDSSIFEGWLVVNKRGTLYKVVCDDLLEVDDGDVFAAMDAILKRTIGIYMVYDSHREKIGIGNTEAAKHMLLSMLPPNCRAAIRGTRDALNVR